MLNTLCIHLIRCYRFFLSPWLGNQCRFHPSCSQYALDALAHHGTFKGLLLMIWRLLRCHPWAQGGVDEVPGLLPPPFSLHRACSHHKKTQ